MRSRDFLVVLDDVEQVRRVAPDMRALAKLAIGAGGVIVTAAGEGEIDYVARFFAPSVGIDEDPVTGSIQCTLAPYWGARLGKSVLRAQQLSARGGSLRCTLDGSRVRIAGEAKLYVRGALELRL